MSKCALQENIFLNSNNVYFIDLDIHLGEISPRPYKEFKGKVYFFLNSVHDPIALVKSSLNVSH